MKKKVLYTASTDIHLINFHIPYLKWFQSQGFEVHVAFNGTKEIEGADQAFLIPFSRNPIAKQNIIAYKQLKNIIDSNNYDLVHCHTPTCGVITRLAARKARAKNTKVIYTAHGFHFYRGSPIVNWLIYFPIEVLLSRFTDALITLNNQDFNMLSRKVFSVNDKFKTNGVGINPTRLSFKNKEKLKLRQSLKIKNEDIIFLYIAEFIPRKNHQLIFKSLKKIISSNPNVRFLFTGGASSEQSKMEAIAKYTNVAGHVDFLGYQKNIAQFINLADIGVSASKAEGLPIGILEIMHFGKPIIASDIRGQNEIVANNKNGYLFSLNKPEEFIKDVLRLSDNIELRKKMGQEAKKTAEKYLISNILPQTIEIYQKVLGDKGFAKKICF